MAGKMSNGDKLLWLTVALLLLGGVSILTTGVSGFFEVLGAILKGVKGLVGVLSEE